MKSKRQKEDERAAKIMLDVIAWEDKQAIAGNWFVAVLTVVAVASVAIAFLIK